MAKIGICCPIQDTVACTVHVTEVLARDYGEYRYPQVHHLIVDTYMAQHPGYSTAAGRRSVAAHLVGLYCMLEMSDLGKVEYADQLHLVWPEHLLDSPPPIQLPPGYSLRAYLPGDESRFFEVMELAGWPGWNEKKLQPWRERLLPQGWTMAIHERSDEIAASAMALHDCCEFGPPGGEIGWIVADPDHWGKGLGLAVSAAATARHIETGCRHIHLYTEDWRLAALKTYLTLGYVPFLYAPNMLERWRMVCTQLHWPLTPEQWKRL